MKSFSGLYSPYSTIKPTTYSNNLSSTRINNSGTLNKNSSSKQFIKITPLKNKNVFLNKSKVNLRQRMSRSIQEIPHLQSDDSYLFQNRRNTPKYQKNKEILVQNCQQEQEQFFNQSYQKLNKVYKNFNLQQNKCGIEQELSQILALIRQERVTIKQKLQQFQSKKKPQITTCQMGQNTQSFQPIQPTSVPITNTIQTQTEQPQKQSQQISSNQTYSKLIKILQDMNINSRQILPQQIKIQKIDQNKKYQQLKQTQIITVQKFVIKKLVQRISVLEGLQNKLNGG